MDFGQERDGRVARDGLAGLPCPNRDCSWSERFYLRLIAQHDFGSHRAERVEPFAGRDLVVPELYVACADVVHHGVAKDVVQGLLSGPAEGLGQNPLQRPARHGCLRSPAPQAG